MKKRTAVLVTLAAVALLASGAVALAATTYSTPAAVGNFLHYKGAVEITTTITEAAPTLSTDGVNVEGMPTTVDVSVVANLVLNDSADAANWPSDAGANKLGYNCKLKGWTYAPVARTWTRQPALDLDVSTGATFSGWTTRAVTMPTVGRFTYQPVTCDVPVTVYLTAVR